MHGIPEVVYFAAALVCRCCAAFGLRRWCKPYFAVLGIRRTSEAVRCRQKLRVRIGVPRPLIGSSNGNAEEQRKSLPFGFAGYRSGPARERSDRAASGPRKL